jgi:hypothetical protein
MPSLVGTPLMIEPSRGRSPVMPDGSNRNFFEHISQHVAGRPAVDHFWSR